DAVRTGSYFVDSARIALKEKAGRPSLAGQVLEMKQRWRPTQWQWFAPAGAIAAGVLLAVVGYQNMVEIPSLRQESPRILARTLVRPAARGSEGSENIVHVGPGQKSFLLDVDVNPEKPFPLYRVEVDTPSGKPIMQTEPA